MQLRLQALATGSATFLPILGKYACRGTGGTASARYCYSVWMRHLIKARQSGYSLVSAGGRIAELGPGDTLGIGLAAMLSGYDAYFALDAKAHADIEGNLAVFRDLLGLFSAQTRIPGDEEFPLTYPKLEDYSFPQDLLTPSAMAGALDARRVDAIVRAIRDPGVPGNRGIRIAYIAPWTRVDLLEAGSIDAALSQAVLEHVDDVEGMYRALHYWLRPGAFMSHTIDYQSHELTRDWNGHWTLGDITWRLVRGTRSYLINRLPHSVHLDAMKEAGFQIVRDETRKGSRLKRTALAKRFRELSDADLETRGSFIQAFKPGAA
jgi:hypothetical protein